MSALLWGCAALALASTGLILCNLAVLGRPRPEASYGGLVSVLIPARNEAANIGAAIDAVSATTNASVEILVLDDHSSDGTGAVVGQRSEHDARVRLIEGRALPAGWQGKVFACQQLADAARGDVLLFIDADVRLAPQAVGSIAAVLEASDAALISGVPHQRTQGLAERLIVPLMHFVLYGYLPVMLMRRSMSPAYGAACGQLIATRRSDYLAAGGHAAVAGSVHDGIALARRFRAAGYATDLIDADALAECRMYGSWKAVVDGFAKNAHEGLGSPRGIVPWTLILLLGQAVPALMLPWVWGTPAAVAAVGATVAAYAGRLAVGWRFGHDPVGVALHPIGVLLIVGIQWYAAARRMLRRPVRWKQRPMSSA